MFIAAAAAVGVGALGIRFAQRVSRNPNFKNLFKSGAAGAGGSGNSKYSEGTFLATMTKKEASEILNLAENAQEKEVKAAHRKLMLANHPDNGGSAFVSAKINEAKDVMLGKFPGKE